MRKPSLSITLLVTLGSMSLFCMSCATISLQSPKPLEAKRIGFGIHAGFLLEALKAGVESDDGGFPIIVNGTAQVGLGRGMELGINVGTLGGEAVFKVGLMAPQNPFQASFITGVSLLYWNFIGVNAGVLGGYTIGDVVRPYAGYRQHLLLPDLLMGDIIGGLEILISKKIGLMFELNHTITFTSVEDYTDGDIDFDDSIDTTVMSGGIVLRL
jgi:hypothetical protein